MGHRPCGDRLSRRPFEAIYEPVATRVDENEDIVAIERHRLDLEAVQRHLEEFLGLQVRIKADDPGKGTVSIRYRTLDQLDLVCQRLTGGEI